MSRFSRFGLVFLAFQVVGCSGRTSGGLTAIGYSHQLSDLRTPETSSDAENEAFSQTEVVCVAVRVDQRIWPRTLTDSDREGLSGHLATELRLRHQKRFGPASSVRFIANHDSAHPDCRSNGKTMFATMQYGPLPSGGPFVADYRVTQDDFVRSGSFRRDVQEELRKGQLPFVDIMEPVSNAIDDDIISRAALIMDYLK